MRENRRKAPAMRAGTLGDISAHPAKYETLTQVTEPQGTIGPDDATSERLMPY
jgi:hypothetical protein